jgi:integrase
MITPKYDGQRWRIRVQRDGQKFSFSSSLPGAQGRRECKAKFERWLYDNEASGGKTCGQVCKEYLEDVAARRGKDSEAYIQNERYIRLYIAPKCASRKLCKITLRDWQSVINDATGRKKALSHKTLENLRAIISAIIKYGYANYQCELLRGSLYIPQGHGKKEKEILQPEMLRRLFLPSDKWYHPLFVFLALTGMRPGEALGLQVDDIQGDRAYIKRSVNAKGVITDGKNENARRMIPLGSYALSVIRATIERNEGKNLHTPWIFCDKYGRQGNQSTMRNQWQELKLERDLAGTVYSLRHTFISFTKSALPESTIKDIVGHSVSMDTFGTYGHIVDGESKKAADVIDLTFGQLFGQLSPTSDGLAP